LACIGWLGAAGGGGEMGLICLGDSDGGAGITVGSSIGSCEAWLHPGNIITIANNASIITLFSLFILPLN